VSGQAVTDETAAPPVPRLATADPPLTVRLRRRHWVLLDYLAAAVCAVLIFGTLFEGTGVNRFPITAWLARDWLPPLLAVCLSIPVAIRRRDPLIAFVWVLAACSVVLALGGEATRGPFLPLMLVLYLLAAARSRAVSGSALAAALALMAMQALAMHLSGHGSGNAVAVSLLLIISWMVGYAVRQRRAYTARLRQQVAEVAVTQERLRIARELHDVVAHSMTVVAVQAGFGEYVFDRQPADARAALGAIQTVTREALTDMQRLLGVLRQDGDPPSPGTAPVNRGEAAAPLAPAPGLAHLDRLVAGTAGAGVRVEVRRTGQARAIPPGIDLAAFRIVQEGLTNVVKHSGADRCQVSIVYGTDHLSVEITDQGQESAGRAGVPARAGLPAGASARAGHGIAGMRERVGLYGGEFSAARLPGRGFRVMARFPTQPGGAR
jgi:signal transduction histidine kinase